MQEIREYNEEVEMEWHMFKSVLIRYP
jgi:hypothetical protein